LLDEVSMGLAPLIVDQIFESMRQLAASNVALLVVEQFVNRALEMADDAALMRRGEIIWQGRASEIDEQALTSSYLGEGQDLAPDDLIVHHGDAQQ
jgi:branched-chain amino acid transport system ATP-binding protein